jgi:hypothetical protein
VSDLARRLQELEAQCALFRAQKANLEARLVVSEDIRHQREELRRRLNDQRQVTQWQQTLCAVKLGQIAMGLQALADACGERLVELHAKRAPEVFTMKDMKSIKGAL